MTTLKNGARPKSHTSRATKKITMKKTILLSLIIIGLATINSCKKKEKEEYVPQDTQRPSVTFTVDGATSSSGYHNIGDTVNFIFNISDNTGLASYVISKTLNSNTTTLQQANISGTSYQVALPYIVDTTITASTTFIIRCTATDMKGNSSLNISDAVYAILIVAGSDISTINGETIFSYQSTTGGFYSLSELQEHDSAFAFNNQGKIDLLFATNTPDTAFVSPKDPFAQTFFKTSAWNVRNNTVFKSTIMGSGTFNSIISSFQINQLYNSYSGTTASGVGVRIGDVVGFETALGKKGFIRVISVNAITGQTIDHITFDIVIQK